MRRILGVFVATVVAVALLFSYRTSLGGGQTQRERAAQPVGIVPAAAGAPDAATAGGSGTGSPGATTAPGTAGQTMTTTTTTTSPPSTPASRVVVVNGSPEDNSYGIVQVQLRVRAGRILSARTVSVPMDNSRDQEINSYAVPILDHEIVQAQNAQIDAVSGATYTSDAYVRSVQAAIDAAHLRS